MIKMEENKLKEAFQKVKHDIDLLKNTIFELREEISDLQNDLKQIKDYKKNFEIPSTQPSENFDRFDTSFDTSTHPSTQNSYFRPLKDQISSISTGNKGVPTDRQTNQQTDRHIKIDSINNAAEILESLDTVKKELRLKFKRLTDQELIIFSTIYQLDEENGFSDYKSIADRLSLTESSIRDYVGRLIKKGIPVEKKKINNKAVQLSVSGNLKKIAPLSTILHLREL